MGFSDSYFPDGVLYKGIMYPTNTQILRHALTNLFRNAACCCVFLYLVVIPLYQYIRLLPVSDPIFYVIFNHFCCHSLPFVATVAFYALLEYVPWARKYKRERKEAQLPSSTTVRKSFMDAIVFHGTIAPALIYFLITTFNQVIPRDKPVQSLPMNFIHFVCAQIVSEVGFFYTHAAGHRKDMYFIHKKHHQYIASLPIATEHTSYAEEIVVEIAPTVFYCILFKVPLPVYGCWVTQRVVESIAMHSGYYFRGSFLERIGLTYAYRTDFHDFHHTANKGNFSNGLFMDALYGTMTPYLRAKQKEREELARIAELKALPVLRASEEAAPVPLAEEVQKPSVKVMMVRFDESKTNNHMMHCGNTRSFGASSKRRCSASSSLVF